MGAPPEEQYRHEAGQTAGRLGARFGARLIDGLLLAVVGGSVGVAMEFATTWLVLQAALVFAYFVLLDVAWGTTIGKRLLGLQVTGPQGGRPSVGQAAGREAFTLLGAVPYAGPLLALVAWIAIAVTINGSPRGQGVHDRLGGGTAVVGTR